MRRFLVRVVHNWPLKLAAIGLATLMYGGLVLSESTQTFNGDIAVVPNGQPADTFLLTVPPHVTVIRYFAPGRRAGDQQLVHGVRGPVVGRSRRPVPSASGST